MAHLCPFKGIMTKGIMTATARTISTRVFLIMEREGEGARDIEGGNLLTSAKHGHGLGLLSVRMHGGVFNDVAVTRHIQ
jgi:hypothetical protein